MSRPLIQLSLRTKILSTFVLLFLLFLAVLTYAVVALGKIGQQVTVLQERYIRLTKVVSRLEYNVQSLERYDLERVFRNRENSPITTYLSVIAAHARALDEGLEDAEALVDDALQPGDMEVELRTLGMVRAQVERVRQGLDTYQRILEGCTQAEEADNQEFLRASIPKLKEHLTEMGASIRSLSDMADQSTATAVDSARRNLVRARLASLGLTGAVVVFGLLTLIVTSLVLRPIGRLTEGVKQIGQGDYSSRVHIESEDEIGSLAREFNKMAQSLAEREALRQRLVQSERLALIGKMSAQVTHEIRNPLNALGLNAELLEEEVNLLDPGAATESRDLLTSIRKEIDRLTEITEQYLSLARLPSPRLELEDVGPIVASLLQFMAEDIERRGLVLEQTIPSGLPRVLLDERQLRQALLNLLRNSLEASHPGGHIRVSVDHLANVVSLTVQDEGEGMSEEQQTHVFDPFFSTKPKGTGLGLSVTQQIIIEHGGSITCQSELGRGTTFVLKLPVSRMGVPADEERV